MTLSGASSETNSAATTFNENPGNERFTLALFLLSLPSFGAGLAPGYRDRPASWISACSLTCKSPTGDLMSTCFSPSPPLSLALMLQPGRTQRIAIRVSTDIFAIRLGLNILLLNVLLLSMGGTS